MADKNTQLISLLNFDPRSMREPILTSPRSIEACRRQGINPKELLIRTAADFKEQFKKKKNIDKDGLELMAEHYEERRKDKIRVLIEERAQLIEDEKNGYSVIPMKPNQKKENVTQSSLTKSSVEQLLATKTDSTLIEKEKKLFEKIKMKQEKELRQLLEYEKKMADIREKHEQEKAEEEERKRLEEIERARAKKEADEKKRQLELEKFRKEQEQEEIRRQLALEAKKKEDAKLAWEQEKERRRQAEIKMKEDEQKRKHEEFLKNLEAKAKEREDEMNNRKREVERQEQARQELLEQQRLQKIRENEQRRRLEEERIRMAMEKNDEIIAKKKMDYDMRQERNEEKRRQYEMERQKKLEEARRAAELHAETIQKVLEDNERLLAEKKGRYLSKQAQEEERQREVERQRQLDMERKAEEEKRKEEARKQVKDNMETILKEKVDKYLEIREQNEEKLMKVKQEKEEEMRRKQHIDLIHTSDKMENIQRKAKMDEYKREKLLEKIQSDNERAQKIKNDRTTLLEMRQAIKKEMKTNKEVLYEQFDLVKRGKLKSDTVLSAIGGQDLSSIRNADTPHTAKSQTLNSTGGRTIKVNRGLVSRSRSPKKPDTSMQMQASPSETKLKLMSDEELKKGLDDLKLKHNQDMLRLLEAEHAKEGQREAKLKAITNPEDKRKLEKEIWAEKERSHLKIRHLTDVQNEAIRQYIAKNNITMKMMG